MLHYTGLDDIQYVVVVFTYDHGSTTGFYLELNAFFIIVNDLLAFIDFLTLMHVDDTFNVVSSKSWQLVRNSAD